MPRGIQEENKTIKVPFLNKQVQTDGQTIRRCMTSK
jgi:hypothetical protein